MVQVIEDNTYVTQRINSVKVLSITTIYYYLFVSTFSKLNLLAGELRAAVNNAKCRSVKQNY